MAHKPKDLLGRRFGRLVVIEKIVIPGVITAWKYRCDCGNEKFSSSTNLMRGNTVSCGCYAIEQRTTHGLTQSRVYKIWKAMKFRCNGVNGAHYYNYGGRGIKVCERWEKFENFLEDMGHPAKRMTLERIDNNGPYSPENCRWATYKEQLSNRRNNHRLTAFGRTQTLTQWAEEYGISWYVLHHRVTKAGLSVEDALTAPKYYQQRRRKSEKPISDE